MMKFSNIYKSRGYDWQDNKDVVFRSMQHKLYTLVNNLIEPKTTELLLDVGCGRGEFFQHCDPTGYIGIDMSRDNIDLCKNRYKEDVRPSKFLVMDSTSIDYHNNSFNKVICTEVLEHLTMEETMRTLFEISRVCKEGGKIVITVPNLYYLWGIMPWNFSPLKRRMGVKELMDGVKKGWAYESYKFPHKRFKPSYFKKILEKYFVVEGYTTSFWYNNRAIHGVLPNFQKQIHNWSWKGNHNIGNNIVAILKNNKEIAG